MIVIKGSTRYVLVVNADGAYNPPSVYGPFGSVRAAQAFAEDYREDHDLPREATPANNEQWTNAGWYFGIVALQEGA